MATLMISVGEPYKKQEELMPLLAALPLVDGFVHALQGYSSPTELTRAIRRVYLAARELQEFRFRAEALKAQLEDYLKEAVGNESARAD